MLQDIGKRKFIRGHLVRSLKFWKSRKSRVARRYDGGRVPYHLVNRQKERVYGGKNCTDDTELLFRPHDTTATQFRLPFSLYLSGFIPLPSCCPSPRMMTVIPETIIKLREIRKLLTNCLPANRILVIAPTCSICQSWSLQQWHTCNLQFHFFFSEDFCPFCGGIG